MKVYVVMIKYVNAIGNTMCYPVEVQLDKVEANRRAQEVQAKSSTPDTEAYVISCPIYITFEIAKKWWDQREPKQMRTPEGTINNCALANGDFEPNCQICGGSCPDRDIFH